MIIRIRKRETPYVIMDKTGLEDPRLSFRAKGLLAYLLSRPDNWTPNRDQLASVSREGVAAVRAAMTELQEAGYFERKRERRDDGTFEFVGYVYEVSIHPVAENQPVEPVVDSPPVVCPPAVNQPVISKEEGCRSNETGTNVPEASKIPHGLPRQPAEYKANLFWLLRRMPYFDYVCEHGTDPAKALGAVISGAPAYQLKRLYDWMLEAEELPTPPADEANAFAWYAAVFKQRMEGE